MSWMDHPFLKQRFQIRSPQDIRRLKENGIREVFVDTQELAPPPAPQPTETSPGTERTGPSPPMQEAADDLRIAIKAPDLPPKKRARTIYEQSIRLMGELLEHPTAANIHESKDAISGMVDLVLNDNDTANQLLYISNHDFYTYTHSVNVGVYAISLAKALYKGDNSHNMHELAAGFFLHDLGKVRLPAGIINKPGKLTEAEMEQVRLHPQHSFAILEETSTLSEECRCIAIQHHERHDGSGYPEGLQGDSIHQYARICCIADVFDALTAKRSYKPAYPAFQALKTMRDEMHDHFEPEMFECFVRLFAKNKAEA